MIASVVATLRDDASRSLETLGSIRLSPQIEVGEFEGHSRRIPMTIDAPSEDDMEDATHWLRERPGVLFVDVVFVHFENPEAVRDDS